MSSSAGPQKKAVALFSRRPAVPVAAAVILGIFIHTSVPILPALWTTLLAILILAALGLSHRETASSLALLLAALFAGLAVAQVEAFYYPRDHISAFATDQ